MAASPDALPNLSISNTSLKGYADQGKQGGSKVKQSKACKTTDQAAQQLNNSDTSGSAHTSTSNGKARAKSTTTRRARAVIFPQVPPRRKAKLLLDVHTMNPSEARKMQRLAARSEAVRLAPGIYIPAGQWREFEQDPEAEAIKARARIAAEYIRSGPAVVAGKSAAFLHDLPPREVWAAGDGGVGVTKKNANGKKRQVRALPRGAGARPARRADPHRVRRNLDQRTAGYVP